jgi:hypothetical protein
MGQEMIALTRPRTGFLLLGMATLVVLAAIRILGPVLRDASLTSGAGESEWITGQVYTVAGTTVYVRSNHALRKHGNDVHQCFENGNGQLFFMQEKGSGRYHAICKLSETNFYDLIVEWTDGRVEERTALRINQFDTYTEFTDWMQVRPSYPATFVPWPEWAEPVLNFIFGF